MRKITTFIVGAAVMCSCVSKKEFQQLADNCALKQDSLAAALALSNSSLEKMTALEEDLEGKVVALRADSISKKRQIDNLTSQNAELKQLNTNLTNKQTAMIKQQAAESKKTLEELQTAREKLQAREDALDSIQLSLAQERKNLEKMRDELGLKNTEISLKNEQIASLEETLRKKDSATVALKTKLEKALVGFQGQGLTIEQRDGKIYVLLDEALLFKVGKSDVAEKGQEALKNLAAVLEQSPDINIMIEGHTDNTGGAKVNWELSTKRALAISYILTENSKIEGKRITVAGRGQYCPIDEANTAEARSKNRRSEIILTPDLQELYNILQGN